MKVLVLADSKRYAKILMSEFYGDNMREIDRTVGQSLYFKDGSVLTFESVLSPQELFYTHPFDQIFTTEYVYQQHRGLLGLIESYVLRHSCVPEEYLRMILTEDRRVSHVL